MTEARRPLGALAAVLLVGLGATPSHAGSRAAEERADAPSASGPIASPSASYDPTHAPAALETDGPATALRRWHTVLLPDGLTPAEPEQATPTEHGAFALACAGAKGLRLECVTRENWSGARALTFRVAAEAGLPLSLIHI